MRDILSSVRTASLHRPWVPRNARQPPGRVASPTAGWGTRSFRLSRVRVEHLRSSSDRTRRGASEQPKRCNFGQRVEVRDSNRRLPRCERVCGGLWRTVRAAQRVIHTSANGGERQRPRDGRGMRVGTTRNALFALRTGTLSGQCSRGSVDPSRSELWVRASKSRSRHRQRTFDCESGTFMAQL
jgi:hypothetical protein